MLETADPRAITEYLGYRGLSNTTPRDLFLRGQELGLDVDKGCVCTFVWFSEFLAKFDSNDDVCCLATSSLSLAPCVHGKERESDDCRLSLDPIGILVSLSPFK